MDLKPNNILIDGDTETRFTAKVADFGLAKLSMSSSQSQVTKQTGHWRWSDPALAMPVPCKVCPANDVWSFGVIIWQMIVREPPYEAYDQLTGEQKFNIPLTFEARHCVPNDLQLLLKRMWLKDFNSRPASDLIICELERIAGQNKDWVIRNKS